MLASGITLGPYKILSPLGAGGMGEVYRARDTRLGRDVALKVIHAAVARDPDRIKRFEQEARAASALSHPNVCAVYDIGTHDSSPYVVMELLEGESLREKLRAGALPVHKAIDYAAQAAHGLAAAHEKGIIHRDLKPENLFVTKDGRVKVLDFGLAKLTRPEMAGAAGEPTVSIAATETGAILGTVGYMSPEQVRGEAADARSDLFALGAILYEMLSGRRAFHEESVVDTLSAILHKEPAPLAASGTDTPAALDPIVHRCLEKSPAERFQNARDLAFALESFGSGQGRLSGAAAAAQGPRPRRRFAWLAAAAAIVLVGVGAWLAWRPLTRWLGVQHAAQPTKKEWILVAEFEGPPDDSTLAAAARSLVSAALDQSEMLATIPPDQLQVALEQAGKPADTRVNAEVARELAYRRAVRGVLEGDVERIGRGYSVVLRVVDAESLKVVLTERGSARNEDDLIPALGKLAKKLRRDLGERRSAIAATRPMTAVATPSFEAYRLLVEARRLNRAGDYAGAIALYHEALRLDLDFTSAWSGLAAAQWNIGWPDSASAAFEEASRRPQRLTTSQRFYLEASQAHFEGDRERALAGYSRVLQIDPTNTAALNGSALTLASMGRFEAALSQYHEAERQSPFGAYPILLGNQVGCLLSLGRIDQARELARRIQGPLGLASRTDVELAACNWAATESMSATRAQDPSVQPRHRLWACIRLALAQAGRGSLRAAEATLVESAPLARGFPQSEQEITRARLFLASETRGAIAFPPNSSASDSSAATLLFRGLRAATTGDGTEARHCQHLLKERPVWEMRGQGADPALLEAWIAALAGRWEEVVRILRPIASQSIETGRDMLGAYTVGLPTARCLLADAFEALDQPDSAAAYLERMTNDAASWVYCGGITRPMAHRRLILLYARVGRLADAQRHLAVLERWWDRPDDVARRMLEEGRAAVQSACSMARPERPRT